MMVAKLSILLIFFFDYVKWEKLRERKRDSSDNILPGTLFAAITQSYFLGEIKIIQFVSLIWLNWNKTYELH